MSRYPDWVNHHKQKGTSIKKVGNSYYLYKTTSKRVQGKKYPQPIQTFIGTITENGVVSSKVKKISTENVVVYEYGFSYALKQLTPEKFFLDLVNKEKAELVFLHIIQSFSPTSYLLKGQTIPPIEDIHTSLNQQIRKLERLIGVKIDDLLPLCYLYLVEVDNCEIISTITEQIKEILEKLEIKL